MLETKEGMPFGASPSLVAWIFLEYYLGVPWASPSLGSCHSSCWCILATDARGWLIMDGDRSTSSGPGSGNGRELDRTRDLPRFRALQGDNTPSPALRGLRMMTKIKW